MTDSKKLTLDQAMQMAFGSWPADWDADPMDAIVLLRDEIVRLRGTLALNAEQAAGDEEMIHQIMDLLFKAEFVLRKFISASDDFVQSTGLKHGYAITDAAERARTLLKKFPTNEICLDQSVEREAELHQYRSNVLAVFDGKGKEWDQGGDPIQAIRNRIESLPLMQKLS